MGARADTDNISRATYLSACAANQAAPIESAGAVVTQEIGRQSTPSSSNLLALDVSSKGAWRGIDQKRTASSY
jgi:hypothetical protein